MLLDGAGLQPSSKGARITFQNGKAEVVDGPFAETKELIAGYWMIQVKSKEEAIEWAKRVPLAQLPGNDRAPEIELRQMFEITDFPDVPADVAEMDAAFNASQREVIRGGFASASEDGVIGRRGSDRSRRPRR